jgi:2,4-dienoyl-CoA reductase-like NADH-dependent reductase (Old Yellow Enzyme family)
MEYDKSTTSGPSEAESFPHESTPSGGHDGKIRVEGPDKDVSILNESITFPFSGRVAKNRFLKAPMTERLCRWPTTDSPDKTSRAFPSDAYTHLYQRWGEGSIGVIVAGNMMIRYDAVEASGNPVLCDDHDNRVAAFRKVGAAAKALGSLFIAQISHPGRQGSATLNPQPVSASDVHLDIAWAGNWFAKPRALTVPEIKKMVRWWGETARLCYEAGFDGVQIHCAHGYLLAQFLSLTTNKRTDEYGGSFENRCCIVFEIIDEVKRVVPDRKFIICVELNSVEFQPRGQTPEDCRNYV